MAQTDRILSSKAYFGKLVEVFPELKDPLWDWDKVENLIHYNMERFADYTISQIKSANWPKLKECFDCQNKP